MVAFCYSKDALSRKPKNPAPYQRKENYQQEELSIEEIAKLSALAIVGVLVSTIWETERSKRRK